MCESDFKSEGPKDAGLAGNCNRTSVLVARTLGVAE